MEHLEERMQEGTANPIVIPAAAGVIGFGLDALNKLKNTAKNIKDIDMEKTQDVADLISEADIQSQPGFFNRHGGKILGGAALGGAAFNHADSRIIRKRAYKNADNIRDAQEDIGDNQDDIGTNNIRLNMHNADIDNVIANTNANANDIGRNRILASDNGSNIHKLKDNVGTNSADIQDRLLTPGAAYQKVDDYMNQEVSPQTSRVLNQAVDGLRDGSILKQVNQGLGISENAIYKLDILQEAFGDMRRRNLALMYKGLSPEERQNLNSPGYAGGKALKAGLHGAAFGGAFGGLGGAIVGGPVGAAVGAGSMGLGIGLGSGAGTYINAKSMQNLDPAQVKIDSKEARKHYGASVANQIQAQGPAVYGR